MIYLVDLEKPDAMVLSTVEGLTSSKNKRVKADVLTSVPLVLVLTIVNGFLESKKIPIRLITVGDGK